MKEGEKAILLDEDGRKYLVKLSERELQTDKGIVNLEEVIDREPGDTVESHNGNEFVVLSPSLTDYLQKIERKAQVVLPKDSAQIVAQTGVGPGAKVVDAGTGSGFLAIFLGNIVRPNGNVISYEIRRDFVKLAEQNIKIVGLEQIVEIKNKDIYRGINEKNLDLVTLDLPRPERVLPHAEGALKPGGFLTAYNPCIEHVQRLYERLPDYEFREYRTIECLVRDFEVGSNRTRPSTRMIAHTGYLSFARRV